MLHRSLVLKWYSVRHSRLHSLAYWAENQESNNVIWKVPAVLYNRVVKIVMHFPLNSNKTPLRHYSLRRAFASAWMGVYWEGGGGGGGEAGYVISMGLKYFQKGIVILEGVNIILKILYLPWGCPYKANGCSWGEWTKVSPFLFEIEHHGVTSVYIWLTLFKLGGEGWNSLRSRFFSSCFHKWQPSSSKLLCLIFHYKNMLW